jgi:hypothetical protein
MRKIIIYFCYFLLLFCCCIGWQNIKYTNEDLELFEKGEYPPHNPRFKNVTSDNVDNENIKNNRVQDDIYSSAIESLKLNDNDQYNYGDDVLSWINSVKSKKLMENSVLDNTANTMETTKSRESPKGRTKPQEIISREIKEDSKSYLYKDKLRYLSIQKIVKHYILANPSNMNQMKIGEQYKIMRSFLDTNNQINYLHIGNATVVKIVDKKVGLKVSLFDINEEITLQDKIQL